MTSSTRKKVDKFFGETKSKSAAKDLDHEGMFDEQMESMFKPTGTKIEMGQKKIGTHNDVIQLKGKAYESKKVSRAILEQESSSNSSYHTEMSEAGESELTDPQVDLEDMEKNAQIYQQLQGQDEIDDDKEIDHVLNTIKNTNKKPEDKKTSTNDAQKAQAVMTQKKVFDSFLHQRILLQKALQAANKLPQKQALKQFSTHSAQTGNSILGLKRDLKAHIKMLQTCQKQMFKISETSIDISSIDTDSSLNQIWSKMEDNLNAQMPFIESTVDRWNERTQLASTITKKRSAFNATIVQQVNQLISEEDSKKKLIQKAQLKRDTYRVLGKDAASVLNEYDDQIYNDHDFYQQLLSDFLAAHEYDEVEDGEGDGDESKFLGNADLNLTQRFLQKRQKLKEAAGVQVKKEVDRKASKNRKIRYVVHEKIVNFLTPLENLGMFEGRQAIVSNMFGVYAQKPTEVIGKKQQISGDVRLI